MTTCMPYLPFIEKMLPLLRFNRIHTWMRAFGHRMPKPSFIWTTFHACTSYTYLSRIWSRQRERANKHKLRRQIRQCSWRARFLSTRHLIRTALRFKRPRSGNFWKRSKNGKWVYGGKDLSSSASYTSEFCNALLDCHEANVELVELHGLACMDNRMGMEFERSLSGMGYSFDIPRSLQPRPRRPRWAAGAIKALPRSNVSHMLQMLRAG